MADAHDPWEGLTGEGKARLHPTYGVHGTVREAVSQLHHARHWATISVVYHHSDPAHASMELTSTALERIDTLGANAARCYIEAYYP